MAPKIFITGTTGYIGGDVLHVLSTTHPEYSISALIRTQGKVNLVTKAYPKVRVVLGSLDDSSILRKEAATADIVIHTADASDHTEKYGTLGEWDEKEFDDWEGVGALTGLPDEAFHRNVDRIVIGAGSGREAEKVKTAVVCPPTIYGRGRGPANARSRQAYEMAHLILTGQYIPIIGAGKARWNHVHVADLADVFVLLTEAAVAKNLDPELWGEKGYLIIENGEHVWADLARLMGKKAEELGFVEGKLEEKELSKEKALDQAGFEAVSWGLNSRAKGTRAKKVLGWKPSRPSLEETVEEILKDEKARLG
ncbi:hypothetical protein BCR34DRAFT_590578 [Clohesyomyces aquaticus]|uniref:NAD-dependent epimerase/dehydratase domain-containing protein n=1 Tax=Clohesyomyces aquaticus TaxID=1231657 RepID=A0A1Y1Z8B1_9PLEO|nr:hypothetical protein BCR34DRAFT_590578 [Clohesyomyces aquaticus]